MEINGTEHQSPDPRIDALEWRMDQIAERGARMSADARTRLQSQLDALRQRLAEIRARMDKREEADERASDAALGKLGQAIDDLYDTWIAGPR